MKAKLLVVFLLTSIISLAQNSIWNKTNASDYTSKALENKKNLTKFQLYNLDFNALQSALKNSPKRFESIQQKGITVEIPNADGQLERFSFYQFSNMDPVLAEKYPEIKSYVGQSIDHPGAVIYCSLSPLGFQSMMLKADRSAVFIEPYTADLSAYAVYNKKDKIEGLNKFECRMVQNMPEQTIRTSSLAARPNADDGILRNFRLALSVTGEYTTYFGGTKALALAGMNATMTRVNGVFEMDFNSHMNLIANNDVLIYTNAATDPYSAAATGSGGAWNTELQNNLTNTIGNAAYDIGHLFGASGGGGNAGCIGCICVDDTASTTDENKGSGFTSPGDAIPQGDNFDIDYVAHEMGHQFGANHTWTHGGNEGTGAQMEPGSGSTIMGYAGITAMDVQPHSDAYFHAISIQQVTNNIKTKTCSTNINTGNAIPTANAGLDYTVPKSTPFLLTGSGTDANGDTLTYCWEQFDNQTTTTAPSATKTSGVNFRSYNPSTNPSRSFPILASVLSGATTTAGTEITVEALPSVARTLNFRLTVRDNKANGGANNSDDMVVTVNATAGPFAITAPNTVVSYAGNTSQTITWNVAGTTANGVNCANVDILLSTNGGTSFPIVLASATPNDGTQALTIPNIPGTTNRIMIRGTNHIFYDISNTNFTITAGTADTTPPTAPTLSASNTTSTTTQLSWSGATDNVAVTNYEIYKNGVLLTTTQNTTYTVTGLTASTAYTFNVKAKDADGNVSALSNTVNVTTGAPDTTPPTAPTLSATGTTMTTTTLSWSGATDNTAVTSYDVYQGATLLGNTTFTTYNVTGLTAATTYTFTVKAKDAAGNASVASNAVNVTTQAPDTTAPTAPVLSGTNITSTGLLLTWSGATDNVGVTSYDVYQGATLLGNTPNSNYTVTGLTPLTSYSFTVKAKDAAGNTSVASNVYTVTTAQFTYCTSQGNSVADELIGRVQFGTIDNVSTGGSGYTDFTNLSTDVTLGSSQTITITPTWTGSTFSEGYAVFIDYNRDGDFADTGETVYTRAASTTTPIVGTFTIPATATTGVTRMRVSLKYNAIPTACETFSYGQVEDYSVQILAASNTLNLKAYIEGFYDVSTHSMQPVQLNQGTSLSTTDVGNIEVELRNPTTYALIATSQALLKTDGTATVTFSPAQIGSFYVAFKYRNSIQTWSANPVTLSASTTSYDFSTAANKAFGSNMRQLETNVWGAYSGDINQDETVDLSDVSEVSNDSDNSAFGDLATDLNGDGSIDLSDVSLISNNSDNSVYSNHP
ncbi:MAG: fibronectin type III domain-containing protein [Bacteroidetes bacterium]|nr:fibronectin type III domain-containing protein [Bacteroidota bacterium]